MLGIKGTYNAIRSASGPAQHIACSIVGLTYAGMFVGMVPDVILTAWALLSVAVLIAVVWLPKIVLKYTLLADFVVSALVLSFYLLHDPKPVGFVYYSLTPGGMTNHSPGMVSMSLVDQISHSAAVIMMACWSLYLANLVHRQLLEATRLVFMLEGEEVK